MSDCLNNAQSLSNFGGQIKNNIGETYFTQSFQEQHKIKDFIRSSNLVNIIESVCENFVKNLRALNGRSEDRLNAIIIKLPFIYSDFLNYSLDLLHFVIDEPLQFANSVKYSVFGIVRDIIKELTKTDDTIGIAANIDIDQVHILVRFLGLPLQTDLCYQPHLHSYRTGLSEVIGILSAVTEPNKVVIQSVWYCSIGCKRNRIRTTSLDIPICSTCRRPMNEYTKLRQTQNVRLLQILPAESLECPHKLNQTFRALTVRVLDHVIDFNLNLARRI